MPMNSEIFETNNLVNGNILIIFSLYLIEYLISFIKNSLIEDFNRLNCVQELEKLHQKILKNFKHEQIPDTKNQYFYKLNCAQIYIW